ncbi:general secretion pathway protein GspA, partial [Acidithiobacillus ferrooxidans]|nr:general secretion pathway protein GspA [Acidithiobacillus ferrooxidans]
TQRQLDQLDEKLFLELYGPAQQPARRKAAH